MEYLTKYKEKEGTLSQPSAATATTLSRTTSMSSPSLSAYKLTPEIIDKNTDPNDIVLCALRFLVPDSNLTDEQLEECSQHIDKGVRAGHIVQTIQGSIVNMVREYNDISEHDPNAAIHPTAKEAIYRILKDAQCHMRGINVAAGPISTNEADGSASVDLADPAWTTYQKIPVDPLLDKVITHRQLLCSPQEHEADKLPFVAKINAVLYNSDAYNILRSKTRYLASVALFVDLADDSLALIARMDKTMQKLREVQRELTNLMKKIARVGGKYEKRQREIRRHRAKLCEYGATEDEMKEMVNEVYLRFF